MDYRILGRTGLKASVIGLGGGGPSRLGQRDSVNTEAESADLLRRGLDAGINFIDTAEGYGTEAIVGQAIAGRPRDSVIISTKKSTGKNPITPDELRAGLEASLKRLGTDYIDIYHLHGVWPENYTYCAQELVPVLLDLKQQGKIRFTGITEGWNNDIQHDMLQQALQDDVWDVMMVGFNILNQTARESVLLPALRQDVGILIMFAVRLALSRAERLREVMQVLIEQGQINPAEFDADDPFGFALEAGGADSLADLAYRFCRDEPGVHVVLSGTGNPAHLQANIDSFAQAPLPDAIVQRLKHIFRNANSATGQ
jgi:aryl-alcohol dehydrogenase-like predicted oxidoreductase